MNPFTSFSITTGSLPVPRMTRLPRTALYWYPGCARPVDQPGVPVQVADAVGAGDAFTAGLIFARLRGWPLASQATFTNQIGALVASRPGAMPVLRDEFARLTAASS